VYEDCARIIHNALPSVLAFVEQSALVRQCSSLWRCLCCGDISHSMEPERLTPSSRIYGDATAAHRSEIFDAIMRRKTSARKYRIDRIGKFHSRAVMEAQAASYEQIRRRLSPKALVWRLRECRYCGAVGDDRAKRLSDASMLNVQPHSGAQANMAVYFSMLKPGDKILAITSRMAAISRTDIRRISPANSMRIAYGVSEKTEQIDYMRCRNKPRK